MFANLHRVSSRSYAAYDAWAFMGPGRSFHAPLVELFPLEESTYCLSRLLHGDGASSSGDALEPPDHSEYDTRSTIFSEDEDVVSEQQSAVGVAPRQTTGVEEEDEFSELEDDEDRYVLLFMPVAVLISFVQAPGTRGVLSDIGGDRKDAVRDDLCPSMRRRLTARFTALVAPTRRRLADRGVRKSIRRTQTTSPTTQSYPLMQLARRRLHPSLRLQFLSARSFLPTELQSIIIVTAPKIRIAVTRSSKVALPPRVRPPLLPSPSLNAARPGEGKALSGGPANPSTIAVTYESASNRELEPAKRVKLRNRIAAKPQVDDGTEPALREYTVRHYTVTNDATERDRKHYAFPEAILRRLLAANRLGTVCFDRVLLPPKQAAVKENKGALTCQVRGAVTSTGVAQWEGTERPPCYKFSKSADSYRRHLIEVHFGVPPRQEKSTLEDRISKSQAVPNV